MGEEISVLLLLATLILQEGASNAAIWTFAGSVLLVLSGAVGVAFAAYRSSQADRIADKDTAAAARLAEKDKIIANLEAENADLHQEVKEAFSQIGDLKVEVLVNRKTLLADRGTRQEADA